MFHEERTIFYTSHAVAAGYKILPKYKKHFYPYLIYSDPEMALELLNKRNITRTEVIYFYEKIIKWVIIIFLVIKLKKQNQSL